MNLYFFYNSRTRASNYFTTSKANITLGGDTYISKTMQRSKYSLDTIDKKNNIDIHFAGNDPFALPYVHEVNESVLTVAIATLNGHLFFRGQLIAVSYEKNEIVLRFEPIVRFGLNVLRERRIYQPNCPYKLYGKNCQATPRTNTCRIALVLSYTKCRIVFDTNNPDNTSPNVVRGTTTTMLSTDKLVGGQFLYPRKRNNWISNIDNTTLTGQYVYNDITLSRPDQFMVVGTAVEVTVGCLRNIDDCHNVHNNLFRFGGMAGLRAPPGTKEN